MVHLTCSIGRWHYSQNAVWTEDIIKSAPECCHRTHPVPQAHAHIVSACSITSPSTKLSCFQSVDLCSWTANRAPVGRLTVSQGRLMSPVITAPIVHGEKDSKVNALLRCNSPRTGVMWQRPRLLLQSCSKYAAIDQGVHPVFSTAGHYSNQVLISPATAQPS